MKPLQGALASESSSAATNGSPGLAVTALVLQARSTQAWIVTTDLGRCRPWRDQSWLSLGHRLQPLLSDLDVALPGIEHLSPLGELGLEFCKEHRTLAVITYDEVKLVLDQGSDSPTHGDAEGVAVSLPGRPHRFGRGNPNHLPGFVVAETREDPAIDLGKRAAVQVLHGLTCLHVDMSNFVARACVFLGRVCARRVSSTCIRSRGEDG